MARYLDPKADVVFKKIFGEHPKLLISFLNAVLPLENEAPIIELEYLPQEHIPAIPAFKRTIADVKCKDSSGRVFVVEMQIYWTDGFKQRLLFGASQAIVKQLKPGENYQLLQPVYGLGIVADTYEKNTDEWYHHYQLVKNSENHQDIINHLQLVFIELPKFPVETTKEKQLRILWLRFLREINERTFDVPDELLTIPEIEQAVDLTRESAYSEGELNSYETYWDSVRTEKTLFIGKYQEGLEQGVKQGLEQGEKKGIEQVALNMLQANIALEKISDLTGLSEAEINKLSDKS